MRKLRYGFIVLGLLFCLSGTAAASVSIGIGIGLPNVSIGINLPYYPDLRPVPGYPVYYAPEVYGNYFFYDGMYWVFWEDSWYVSSWYNGPWALVDPYVVPVYILRVPVFYYRYPPPYFRGWAPNRPPHWGRHWGPAWQDRRHGWDRWDRSRVPHRAPLPVYQRSYAGDRYPSSVEQQQRLRRERYRYVPKQNVVREHLRETERRAPAMAPRPGPKGPSAPPARTERAPERMQRQAPMPHEPRMQRPEPRMPEVQPPMRHEERMQRMPEQMQPRQEHMQPRQERAPQMERRGGPERQERGRGPERDEGGGR